jgi:hypothetical protein
MFHYTFWTMLGVLIALAIAVAGEMTAAFSKPNHRDRKRYATIIAIMATVLASMLVSYQLLDGQSAFPSTVTLVAIPSINTTVLTPSDLAFNFENGKQHWGTSEGNFKPTKVGVTTNPVHSGRYALQITTVLLGNANPFFNASKEVYRHTEATVYFDQGTPNGFSVLGPYNLRGKRVSCFVFLPSGLATGDDYQNYVRIFVKDIKFANDFSTAIKIDLSVTDHWIQLSLVVGTEINNADASFDPTRVNAMGIRIETSDNSTTNYNGAFYIDDCIIQTP